MSVTTVRHGHPTVHHPPEHNFEVLLWGMVVVFSAIIALVMAAAIFTI